MAGRQRASRWNRALRLGDVVFDSIGMRPLGIAVFAGSALLFAHTVGFSYGAIRADAVALAPRVDHPARVASFVTAVFVRPGDRVEVGAPLAELSPYFIEQRLTRMDLEIEQLINESKLAQARLIVEEERWVAPNLRTRPNRPSLAAPTEAYFAKQLEVLRTRREALLEELEALVVRSRFPGVVAEVVWLGASIGEGASVASVMPEFAEEIVAYVLPTTDPESIRPDARAYIVAAEREACRSPGRVRRRGATVIEAPRQLTRFFRPVHGTPVHISIPESCRLANGRVLEVDFENGDRG